MKLLWHPLAADDFATAVGYIQERSPTAAQQFAATVLTAVERLADFPQLGRLGRVPPTRELVIGGTRYVVAYLVDEGHACVVVLRLLHGAQQWPASFDSTV